MAEEPAAEAAELQDIEATQAEEAVDAPVEEQEPEPPRRSVLFTASVVNDVFGNKLIEKLVSKQEEEGSDIGDITVLSWPRGKFGHQATELPPSVKIVEVKSITDDAFCGAVHNTDILICGLYEHITESKEAVDIVSDATKEENSTTEHPERVVIAISNVLSWAQTDVQEGEVLCEEDYTRRKPHPNHTELMELEKHICRASSEKLRVHAVNAGLCYGHDQGLFSQAFEDAWNGDPVRVPLIQSEGANMVPCVHYDDLSNAICNLLDVPDSVRSVRHVLAVDRANSSLSQVLSEISQVLGCGTTAPMTQDATFMLKSQESLELNLSMEPASINTLNQGCWTSRDGIVAQMAKMADEFKQCRGLKPMKIVVGGPPYSGKSRMAEELAQYYRIPCICIDKIPAEMSGLEEDWQQYAEVGLSDMPPEVLREMVHRKFSSSHSCRTHGWVLDGFPATDAELRNIFCDQLDPEAEPPEGEAAEALVGCPDEFKPTHVVWLDMSDDAIRERLENPRSLGQNEEAPEDEEDLETRLAALNARLEAYRALEAAAEGVDVKAKHAVTAAPGPDLLSRELYKALLNSDTEPEEPAAEEPAAEEPAAAEEEPAAAEEEPESSCKVDGALIALAGDCWPDTSQTARSVIGAPTNIAGPGRLLSEEWEPPVVHQEPEPEPLPVPPQIAEIRRQKAEAITNKQYNQRVARNQKLAEMARPLRGQLLATVMPTLTEGLIKTCESQPCDPIDMLQRFLHECEEKQNKEATKAVTLEQMLKELEDSVLQQAAAAAAEQTVIEEKPAEEQPVVEEPVEADE